jgi:hypothetical protein
MPRENMETLGFGEHFCAMLLLRLRDARKKGHWR